MPIGKQMKFIAALGVKTGKILETARQEWARRPAGKRRMGRMGCKNPFGWT
jgi:hypothetical protein